MFDLALPDQILDRAGDFFHRHFRIDAMLVEEIDAIRLEAFERRLSDLSDALRPAVHAARRIPLQEAEFGGNHDLIAERSERLASDPMFAE